MLGARQGRDCRLPSSPSAVGYLIREIDSRDKFLLPPVRAQSLFVVYIATVVIASVAWQVCNNVADFRNFGGVVQDVFLLG